MRLACADATRLPLPDRSVDLVIGSPPYLEARTYGMGKKARKKLHEWVPWMLDVTREACRVSRGLVIWVCAGQTKRWCYQPGPEGLLYRWVAEKYGLAWRPVYWRRVGIPGSGAKVWYRADIEYCLAFTLRDRLPLPHAVPTANGHPPRWAPGGAMSHRLSDGSRRNQWGGGHKSSSTRRQNGKRQPLGRPSHEFKLKRMKTSSDTIAIQEYKPPVIANPGNVLEVKVGGNQMGHKLAHESVAPYPVGVPRWFIQSHCPLEGLVLDPFMGSGTTAQAAEELGRLWIGLDAQMGQCELTRRRMEPGVQRLLLIQGEAVCA